MKTDRELLELAAKAAGIKIDKSEFNGGGRGNTGFDILGNAVIDWHNNKKWNPLTDDGDALRLAVSLRLWIQVSERCAWAQQDAESILGEAAASSMVMFSEVGNDPYAATRRAIVRAAAAIGEGMK